MSTYTTNTSVMEGACRDMLRTRLRLDVVDTETLSAVLDSVHLLPLGTPDADLAIDSGLRLTLATLAPTDYSLAVSALRTQPADANGFEAVSSCLSAAVREASAAIDLATRDLVSDVVAQSADELGYAVQRCRGNTVTSIEMRLPDEVMLVRVHPGGLVYTDHAGLSDHTCGDRQRRLEATMRSHGLTLANTRSVPHLSRAGGELIGNAARCDPTSLARGSVRDAERPVGGRSRGTASDLSFGEPARSLLR